MESKTSLRLVKPGSSAVSPLRASLTVLQREVRMAAVTLGYDFAKRDWARLLRKESANYPCTLEGGDYDFLNQLPEGGVARIRAIELIDSFSDLLPQLESAVADAEQWRAELHSQLAANPLSAPQLVDLLKQLEWEAA